MSLIPLKDICNVLGIGVAESVSTSTVDLIFFKASLCFTPNLCSSSMTTRPKFGKFISLDIILCVPIKISTNPFLASSIICFCCFGVLNLLKTSTLKG